MLIFKKIFIVKQNVWQNIFLEVVFSFEKEIHYNISFNFSKYKESKINNLFPNRKKLIKLTLIAHLIRKYFNFI
jgi:hypothetical protein